MVGDDERREGEISPAEFTRRMEEGESAGPGAPETVEPRGHGRRGADDRPDPDQGPGGPAMKGIGGSGPSGNEVTGDDAG